MNQQTRQKIILSASDNSLDGKISSSTEHLYVLLDSTDGAFTVTLPDAQSTMRYELIFKHKKGSAAVTVQSRQGQFIDLGTNHVLNPLDCVGFWPDLVDTWNLQDSNALASPLIVKDTASPAHYWQIQVSTVGVLSTVDLGTSI